MNDYLIFLSSPFFLPLSSLLFFLLFSAFFAFSLFNTLTYLVVLSSYFFFYLFSPVYNIISSVNIKWRTQMSRSQTLESSSCIKNNNKHMKTLRNIPTIFEECFEPKFQYFIPIEHSDIGHHFLDQEFFLFILHFCRQQIMHFLFLNIIESFLSFNSPFSFFSYLFFFSFSAYK